MSTTGQQDQLPGPVIEFLQSHNTVTLATASSAGIPRAATFLYVNDGPSLYFWTRTSTVDRSQHRAEPVRVVHDRRVHNRSQPDAGHPGVRRVPTAAERRAGRPRGRPLRTEVPLAVPGRDDEHRVLPDHSHRAPVHRQLAVGAGLSQVGGQFGADFHRETSYSMFGVLPPQATETISATLQRVNVGPDDVIARAGGPANKFFIVVDGEVEVRREAEGAPETVTTDRARRAVR